MICKIILIIIKANIFADQNVDLIVHSTLSWGNSAKGSTPFRSTGV